MNYQEKIAQIKHNHKINNKEYKKLMVKLRKMNPRHLDDMFHDLHDEVFEKTDCLQCGNCCKTTSPMFFDKDIERLAKHFRMKAADFISKYLVIDEDDYYVLKTSPCPFLADDNYCLVYDVRPNACKEYPHTNRKKMFQILDLTHANSAICPAVSDILEKIMKTAEAKKKD